MLPPSAHDRTPELQNQIEATLAERGSDYVPRTRHFQPDGKPSYTNRLILESSPYLNQHAHNPVDWSPWGEEAFERARELGRPVLLSVGYSTCHWCHVMEHESFEDPEIARIMNELYVPVKVDREERPDVDAIYMRAVVMMTRRGGWPMTVWLTPDRKPYYAGTYFPPRDGDRGSRIGFLTMLHRLREVYDQQPDKVAESANALVTALRESLEAADTAGDLPGPGVLHDAYNFYANRFDSQWGGLQTAPKFPSSLSVRFLLRYHRRTGDAFARTMAETSLDRMAAGGMHDQVGGGFHRYSVDAQWLVPHFEKMLYDNALLTMAYLEGFQVTGRAGYAEVVRDLLHYIELDMTSPEGLFYAATDADSEGEEGLFFLWTPEQLVEVLGEEDARIVGAYYGVKQGGNFEGETILNVPRSAPEVAADLGIAESDLRARVRAARPRLREARATRVPPLRDDKILVAWNALMISAHARASIVLGDDRYAEVAVKAASGLLERVRRPDGRLHRTWAASSARHDGVLEDHAFMVAALLDLFEATWDPQWLREAKALQAVQDRHFLDAEDGGYFMTAHDAEVLLAREKPANDGAEPTGNSVAALNLYRLSAMTGDDTYRALGDRVLEAFSKIVTHSPTALSEMLLALDFRTDQATELVLVAPTRADATELVRAYADLFQPNTVLVGVESDAPPAELAALTPLGENRGAQDGQPTAYVCHQGVCRLPTVSPAALVGQLTDVEPLPRQAPAE